MTKLEFINYYSESHNTTKKAATEIVENMIETITEVLANGDDISIVGFGKIGTKERAGRVGRNPKTGEEIQIPASKSIYFKAGKLLKQAINE